MTAQLVTDALIMAIWRRGQPAYWTRDHAKADVFDYIERFYNVKRRHSTIEYMIKRVSTEPAAGQGWLLLADCVEELVVGGLTA